METEETKDENIIKSFTKGNHENVISLWESKASDSNENINLAVIECVVFSFIELKKYTEAMYLTNKTYDELLKEFPSENKSLQISLANLIKTKLIIFDKLGKAMPAFKTLTNYIDDGGIIDDDISVFQKDIESKIITKYIFPLKRFIIGFIILYGIIKLLFRIELPLWMFYTVVVFWIFLILTYFYPSMSDNFSRYLIRLFVRMT